MPKKNIGKPFEQIRAELQQVMDNATTIASVEAVKHFKKSFQNEGFTDSTFTKWKDRKDKKNTRKILTGKTKRLQKGVRELQKTKNTAKVGVDLDEVPYAEIQNNGGVIQRHARSETFSRNRGENGRFAKTRKSKKIVQGHTIGEHTITIPAREFIGNSQVLNNTIDKKISTQINKIIK